MATCCPAFRITCQPEQASQHGARAAQTQSSPSTTTETKGKFYSSPGATCPLSQSAKISHTDHQNSTAGFRNFIARGAITRSGANVIPM
jgi:hypothetical protein